MLFWGRKSNVDYAGTPNFKALKILGVMVAALDSRLSNALQEMWKSSPNLLWNKAGVIECKAQDRFQMEIKFTRTRGTGETMVRDGGCAGPKEEGGTRGLHHSLEFRGLPSSELRLLTMHLVLAFTKWYCAYRSICVDCAPKSENEFASSLAVIGMFPKRAHYSSSIAPDWVLPWHGL